MNDLYKDSGFILLLLIMIMIFGFLVSSCSTEECGRCPEVGHGPCPFEEQFGCIACVPAK
jgi:hypothetical protein